MQFFFIVAVANYPAAVALLLCGLIGPILGQVHQLFQRLHMGCIPITVRLKSLNTFSRNNTCECMVLSLLLHSAGRK